MPIGPVAVVGGAQAAVLCTTCARGRILGGSGTGPCTLRIDILLVAPLASCEGFLVGTAGCVFTAEDPRVVLAERLVGIAREYRLVGVVLG